ncbi:response regulator receiver domain-containing protein [Winogradskyella eximia]|jgi:CheY-like chemotaxis protein|uniref:Response regulator receiver domain-containing protein n=1 Tax=Winogradskyella eximia TaxID=262006 RepID=A0A3D9HAU0_9FLAO|nr:response regulator [Winogradskyella eximia]RED46589.1 response regulator receiver domain-containing protein [Winogradskyella eximia]|tara:strand:- start:195 stop:605 length:411 start_codon:yes stop_codon:yes gene_type:complete
MSKKIKLACIIDDDNIYVKLVRKIIETRKLCDHLLIFKDGKEGIDYFETLLQNFDKDNIPEVILLDLNMPVMDGWEFLERFTKIKNKFNNQITLYVVSSSINSTDIDKAKSLSSVENYLIKPVRINELEAVFKKIA